MEISILNLTGKMKSIAEKIDYCGNNNKKIDNDELLLFKAVAAAKVQKKEISDSEYANIFGKSSYIDLGMPFTRFSKGSDWKEIVKTQYDKNGNEYLNILKSYNHNTFTAAVYPNKPHSDFPEMRHPGLGFIESYDSVIVYGTEKSCSWTNDKLDIDF